MTEKVLMVQQFPDFVVRVKLHFRDGLPSAHAYLVDTAQGVRWMSAIGDNRSWPQLDPNISGWEA